MKSRKQSRIIVALNGLTFIVWLLFIEQLYFSYYICWTKTSQKMQTYFFPTTLPIKVVTSFWDWFLKWKFFRSVYEACHTGAKIILCHWIQIWICIERKYFKCILKTSALVIFLPKTILLPQCVHWSICHLAVALFKR